MQIQSRYAAGSILTVNLQPNFSFLIMCYKFKTDKTLEHLLWTRFFKMQVKRESRSNLHGKKIEKVLEKCQGNYDKHPEIREEFY